MDLQSDHTAMGNAIEVLLPRLCESGWEVGAPARIAPSVQVSGSFPKSRSKQESRIHVLLIEDNPADAFLIEDALAESDAKHFELFRAGTLGEAQELLGDSMDVALVDLNLPDSRGLETLRAIRGDSAGLPIIVLTGLDDEQLAVQALKEGAQDFLVKGRHSAELLRRSIRYAMERNHSEQMLRDQDLRLLQAEKMEAIGRLAGGIAHDFNNLLTVIGSYADFVIEKLEGQETVQEDLRFIRDAVDRAEGLTSQLLAFGRRQVFEERTFDMNDSVETMVRMLDRIIGDNIQVTASLHATPLWVNSDCGKLEQAIMNLALNARDAMPDGGQLVLRTRSAVIAEDAAASFHEIPPGSYACLDVSDTGHGMDAETKARIFEPFFSTKSRGEGTGLGLASVYGIVKQAEGHICVDSMPGAGTTFSIYLPRTASAPSSESTRNLRPVQTGGHETVLLVEDERAVRNATQRILKSGGYDVVCAEDGAQALQLCQRREGGIDLLVTDVVMPEMSGVELARRMRQHYPHMRVLYTSGYARDVLDEHGGLSDRDVFVQKPFTMRQLLMQVREALQDDDTLH